MDEERQHVALHDRPAVESLHREPPAPIGAYPLDERRDRGPEPLGVGVAQRQQRSPAALDVERRFPAEEDDVGARNSCGARAGAPRPRQHAAVRLRGVGGREDERLVVVGPPKLAQPLDRAGERELSPAQPLHEVAAAARPDGLERLQLAVDRSVAAGDTLGPDAVPGDDALALEQELRERPAVARRRRDGCAEDPRGE